MIKPLRPTTCRSDQIIDIENMLDNTVRECEERWRTELSDSPELIEITQHLVVELATHTAGGIDRFDLIQLATLILDDLSNFYISGINAEVEQLKSSMSHPLVFDRIFSASTAVARANGQLALAMRKSEFQDYPFVSEVSELVFVACREGFQPLVVFNDEPGEWANENLRRRYESKITEIE